MTSTMNVATKVGVFAVSKNESNDKYTDIYHNGRKIVTLPAMWWNKDEIVNAIEQNAEVIKEKMSKVPSVADMQELAKLREKVAIMEREQNKVNITQKNVVEVLQNVNNTLSVNINDAQMRGFVCSRLKQVINKLVAEGC